MGKRKGGGLTGLSRFVLESFKNDPASQPLPPESTVQDLQYPTVETLHASKQDPGNHPPKRRKTKSSNAEPEFERTEGWIKKYDATGLVPHYTNISQVPDHLRKCVSSIDLI